MVSVPSSKIGPIRVPSEVPHLMLRDHLHWMMRCAKAMGIGGTPVIIVVQVHLHIQGEVCMVCLDDVS